MHADCVAVEQLRELSPSRPAGQAAGMDLSSGEKSPMAAGADVGLTPGQNGRTADTQADGEGVFCPGNKGKATACSAICHTLAGDQQAGDAVVFDGGEGIERHLDGSLYDTFGRAKIIHIATGLASPATPSGLRRNRPQKKEGAAVEVVVVGPASLMAWRKSLLGREKNSGAICAVRLKQHGAKASRFAVGQILRCRAVGPHEFHYEGGHAA